MSNIKSENGYEHESILIEVKGLLKANIRDYAMYIALVVIFIFFGIRTDGLFLSSRNISDLINQTGYVAVLAIGMTIILIIKHIDLSVGYVAGFLGAVTAILLQKGLSVWLVIPIILLLGICVGMYQGFLVTKVGVPAFVTTLAGMFMFRGLLSRVTEATGTIIVNDETFKKLSNGFIPDIKMGGNLHEPTIILGIIAIILVIVNSMKSRKNMEKYNFKVTSKPIFITFLLFISAIIFIIVFTLAKWKGIPWTAVIVGIVLVIYNFILNKTKLGRYIYGIGGNSEAAELSGVNVKKITFFAFASMSMLAALAGMLYTSRLASASAQAGLGFELDAIASSYIGGVSVNGGIGRVTNTIIGAFIIMSLSNGMNLMGVDVSYQYIVKGAIFIIAVAFDVKTRGGRK